MGGANHTTDILRLRRAGESYIQIFHDYLVAPYPYSSKSHNPAQTSTPKALHLANVAECVEMLKQCDSPSKVVLARHQFIKSDVTPDRLFEELCEQYPDANVFRFSSSKYGEWIGASPEMLMRVENGRLYTMALAGTRESGTHEPWGDKEVVEQKIVADQIVNDLKSFGLQPTCGPTVTCVAGNVEHILTPIEAEVPNDFSSDDILQIACKLSPTPALCGYPREMAATFIAAHEDFDRGPYGGFFGTVADGEAYLMVNLRSCRYFAEHGIYELFAGGGITAKSEPETEWEETEAKMTTIGCRL